MDKKVFDIISKIADEHSHKTFGYLSKEDLVNEIWIICLERLKFFKKSKGKLEHFLRVSVKNRLINKFKKITKTVRSPCPRCKYYDKSCASNCAKFGDERQLCNKWTNYQLSINSRNSLLNPTEQKDNRSIGSNSLSFAITNEIRELVKDKIDKVFLPDFNILMDGGKISKNKLKKLKIEINKIIDDNNNLIRLTINGE
jgi:hypothetical protein